MKRRILFVSRGHTGIVDADGTGLRFLRFDVPGQVTWQPGPVLSGGRRLVLFSCETGKTWEGKVRTHLWLYDLKTGGLTEIADRNRPADFMPCAGVMPGEARRSRPLRGINREAWWSEEGMEKWPVMLSVRLVKGDDG